MAAQRHTLWHPYPPRRRGIQLRVYYDPSPKWQMKPLSTYVTRALCYHNTRPMMWLPGLGNLGAVNRSAKHSAKVVSLLTAPQSRSSTSRSSRCLCRPIKRFIGARLRQWGHWQARRRYGRNWVWLRCNTSDCHRCRNGSFQNACNRGRHSVTAGRRAILARSLQQLGCRRWIV